MANNKLAKVEKQIVAIAGMTAMDLRSKESVDALVRTAADIQEQKKQLDAHDKEIKDNFKRMCREEIDANKNVTCYSWDEGKKMTIVLRGGSAEIDEAKLLAKLYEAYGEEPGDRSGRAWQAFIDVTDEVEMPRVLNQDKLAKELIRAERIMQGLEGGAPSVTQQIVEAATTFKKPVVAASLGNITKAEMEAHKVDGYAPVFVAQDKQ